MASCTGTRQSWQGWGPAAEGRSATHHIGRGLRKEGLPARTPRHRAARSSAHARRCRAAAAARLACGVLLVRPLARARAQAARPGARAAVGREGVSGGSRRTDWPRLQGAAQERRGSGVFSSRRHVGRALLYQSCHLIRCRLLMTLPAAARLSGLCRTRDGWPLGSTRPRSHRVTRGLQNCSIAYAYQCAGSSAALWAASTACLAALSSRSSLASCAGPPRLSATLSSSPLSSRLRATTHGEEGAGRSARG